MTDIKTELRNVIKSGERLTVDQDDEAYALLSPQEYSEIPDDQKPEPQDDVVEAPFDVVKHGLEQAAHIFKTFDPIAWVDGTSYVEWCTASAAVDQALANVQDQPYQRRMGSPANASRVLCVTNGQEFPSIASAARFCGCSPTMISNHLAGKPGYTQVRGFKFQRITDD